VSGHEWVRRDGGWRCARCGALVKDGGTGPSAADPVYHLEWNGTGFDGQWMVCDELLVHRVMTS
jgi:hypothetical protein